MKDISSYTLDEYMFIIICYNIFALKDKQLYKIYHRYKREKFHECI